MVRNLDIHAPHDAPLYLIVLQVRNLAILREAVGVSQTELQGRKKAP
ncbi:MAG: hypothetical protein ACR2O2_10510 [Ruegeria sp.]